jgi:membrane dipeptidase
MKRAKIMWVILMLGSACSQSSLDEIHERILTIDTHVDTPLRLNREGFDIGKMNDREQGGGRLDFPRMKKGGLDAAFFAVFLGQGPRTEKGHFEAKKSALEIFADIDTALMLNSHQAELALTSQDGYRIEKTGKRAVYIGIENGYPLGRDLTLLETFYDLGARYLTLCHTKNNEICDSSTDPKGPEHQGLSDFGRKVIHEMNRLGMIIDVSHSSDKAFYDVLKETNAPVIASHSCSRAICDHPRNLDDDMLRALAANGGVIQMCILSDYVKTIKSTAERDSAIQAFKDKYNNFDKLDKVAKQKAYLEWEDLNDKFPKTLATVSDVVDHIDHIVNVVGIDHVGIGTDFDGGGGVEGCNDVSEMKNITQELLERGYSEKEVEKIWGGNFIRVFRQVEKNAGEYSRSR